MLTDMMTVTSTWSPSAVTCKIADASTVTFGWTYFLAYPMYWKI